MQARPGRSLHAFARVAGCLWLLGTLLVYPLSPAQAYMGPGSGLSAIGSLLALIGVIGFAIIGFVWYPIKRLWKRLRSTTDKSAQKPDPPE